MGNPDIVELLNLENGPQVLYGGNPAIFATVKNSKMNSTNLAGFTSRGPTADGRIKPDVAAPGHTIYSTYSDGEFYTHQCGGEVDAERSTLTTMSGTSMATPITAGS